MKLSRQMLVWLLVPVLGATCEREASPEESGHWVTEPDWFCDVVSPATVKAFVGDTIRFTASPCGGGVTRTYVWRAINPAIAEVDSISGLVRTKSVGSTAVVATRVQDPAKKAAALVEVTARP